MEQYTLKWPEDFEAYSGEIESKGWFVGLEIVIEEKTLRPVFYDPVRLSQDVDEEISTAGFFLEPCLIVVRQVTRETIERTVAELAKSGGFNRFV